MKRKVLVIASFKPDEIYIVTRIQAYDRRHCIVLDITPIEILQACNGCIIYSIGEREYAARMVVIL